MAADNPLLPLLGIRQPIIQAPLAGADNEAMPAVAGLSIGGIGASTISASGEVYKLNNIAQFPGAYAQGRY